MFEPEDRRGKLADNGYTLIPFDIVLLLEAKVMFRQIDLSIGEISHKMRQQDASNFGRFFKAKTGLTPQGYRNMD